VALRPEHQTWWVEFVHDDYGVLKLTFTWERQARGVYAAVVRDVQFDFWTPTKIRNQITDSIKKIKMRGITDDSSDGVPW